MDSVTTSQLSSNSDQQGSGGITIADATSGRTYSGTRSTAFDLLLASLEQSMPLFSAEAKQLRDLWMAGSGSSDEALMLCASLGVTVSQD